MFKLVESAVSQPKAEREAAADLRRTERLENEEDIHTHSVRFKNLSSGDYMEAEKVELEKTNDGRGIIAVAAETLVAGDVIIAGSPLFTSAAAGKSEVLWNLGRKTDPP